MKLLSFLLHHFLLTETVITISVICSHNPVGFRALLKAPHLGSQLTFSRDARLGFMYELFTSASHDNPVPSFGQLCNIYRVVC